MRKATRNTMENTKGGLSAATIVRKGSRQALKILECNNTVNHWGKYAKCSCGYHSLFGFKRV